MSMEGFIGPDSTIQDEITLFITTIGESNKYIIPYYDESLFRGGSPTKERRRSWRKERRS